ncbi:MAG: hypothetical protein JNL67_09765 [Planctomycetaceae bacterium]|nr:hypothetical protein [Planctomycetaceae bacterium]
MMATIRAWLRFPVKKQTLRTIDPEQLRRERIRVEQTELKFTRDIEELEKQKEELFRKGIAGASDRQRIQIARKIKQLDAMVQAKDRQLALLSKNLQVLSTVAQLKENERMLKDLGMEGVVNNMDLSEVQAYVERATIEGQFQMERFSKLLQSVSDADAMYNVEDVDAETQSILEIMNTAAQNRSDETIRDGLAQMEQLLHKEANPS